MAQSIVIAVALGLSPAGLADERMEAQAAGEPGKPAVADLLEPRSLGSDDAPVTIVEYSSLTCPHCASFHTQTLPRIKETYIDTGKVRLVFDDFPLDVLALGAAMLARCVERERYFAFLDTLFREQAKWSRSDDPLGELAALAKGAGLSEAAFKSCLNNGPLMTGLKERANAAGTEHAIRSTPTFLIEGDRIEGAIPYDSFKEIIDRKLGEEARETRSGPRRPSSRL